jgi:hypothetical protein
VRTLQPLAYAWVVACWVFALSSAFAVDKPVSLVLGHGANLTMVAAPFNPKRHSVERCQHEGWSGVCLIDGKPVFGTDGEVPRTRLERATLQVGGQSVNLDTTCMYDPWVGSPDPKSFWVTEAEGGLLVSGRFSDGAGGYVAQWLVVKGGSVRTVLSGDEQVLAGEDGPDP